MADLDSIPLAREVQDELGRASDTLKQTKYRVKDGTRSKEAPNKALHRQTAQIVVGFFRNAKRNPNFSVRLE